eukprot:TRINITY_DN8786_c0_g1_i1.p1 TRINITY_DN8786_c0_g1~~TRINITY_DN8786_c0_g1_i1.p1  ORF type:complete len:153 (-),score=23.39 TRINITY_DN8786_c0_g1_i1:482-940(-)
MTALDDTLVPIDPAEEEPDPYVVPGNYPEPIQHFIQICGRGPASFNRNPEEGDLQMLMEGVSDDVEVMVPKVYEVKTVKEGGDPILIHGKEKMEWALTCCLCTALHEACPGPSAGASCARCKTTTMMTRSMTGTSQDGVPSGRSSPAGVVPR